MGRRVGWRCVRRKVGWFEVLDGDDMSTGAHLQENVYIGRALEDFAWALVGG